MWSGARSQEGVLSPTKRSELQSAAEEPGMDFQHPTAVVTPRAADPSLQHEQEDRRKPTHKDCGRYELLESHHGIPPPLDGILSRGKPARCELLHRPSATGPTGVTSLAVRHPGSR